MTADTEMEDLLRPLVPQVLGVLMRHCRDFDTCEDAVQESLLAAALQWPDRGVPKNPKGWLIRVAQRRMADRHRSESARMRREATAAALTPHDEFMAPAPDAEHVSDRDDTLTLLFLCCHPALSSASQIALTLRAVGGLTTKQIAHAFLVPETSMGQRISRAKQRIKASGIPFRLPPEPERDDRLQVVLQVLYLIFNEGYTATSGSALQRSELTGEAIRVTRILLRLLPDDGEVAGLLALMLLTEARRAARTGSDGMLIPLAEQDRTKWNKELIREGIPLITDALARARLGPYQLQAAIAAVHAEAATAEQTDWAQILALYRLLDRISPDRNPVVMLNHVVAVAMAKGPRAGLQHLETLESDRRLATLHRLDAVQAHLLEMVGDYDAARVSYRRAARRTTSLPERRYLETQANRLSDGTA